VVWLLKDKSGSKYTLGILFSLQNADLWFILFTSSLLASLAKTFFATGALYKGWCVTVWKKLAHNLLKTSTNIPYVYLLVQNVIFILELMQF